MNILHITRTYYPRMGGIENVTMNLCYWLKTRGHQVEVVTLDHDLATGEPFKRFEIVDDIPVHRLRFFGSRRYPVAVGVLSYLRKPDIIHIHGIDFFVDFCSLTRRIGLHHTPLIVNTHGGVFHSTKLRLIKQLYCRSLLYISLHLCDAVICDSDNDQTFFTHIAPKDRLLVIHNGVDIAGMDSNSKDHKRNLIIAFGRLSPAKNIDMVIRLWAHVARDVPDAELVIIGREEANIIPVLEKLAADLGVRNQTLLTGQLPRSELIKLLKKACLFISASHHEGFGIATVEALASGVPVLVTPTGIHQNIIKEGINGWYWSGQPDEKSVVKLRKIMKMTEVDRSSMQEAARASAQPFRWEQVVLQYEDLYERVCRQFTH